VSDVIVFHHAQGLTSGVVAFANALRDAGHRVMAPDLYEGRTFRTLQEGISHVDALGIQTLAARGIAAADEFPPECVYIGFSLGVMPAQKLAQTRPGAKGAVLVSAAVSLEYFGPWPDGLPLQMHVMEDDRLGDVDIARDLARTIASAQLFLYKGDHHLFADRSLPTYDGAAATLLKQRVLEFLQKVS
jgi:dienelactone hydrolase